MRLTLPADKTAAEASITAISEVGSVTNNIVVTPAQTEDEDETPTAEATESDPDFTG